jgi:HNH endonuclease
MKGTAIRYSADELAWIKACCDLPRAELHALFIQIWQRPEVTVDNLKSLCTRRGWKTGRTGQFHADQVAYNKGKKGYHAPGSEKGWFRKGQQTHNYRGPGHERIDSKDGYVVMIVYQVNPWTGAATRPVLKHRYLWEQVNGPVPKGMRLKCLDGDKTNTDPSNWKAIPHGMAPRLNGIHGRAYDKAPADLKPTIMAIAQLEHQARELRKAKKEAKHG